MSLPDPEIIVRDSSTGERAFGLPRSRITSYEDLIERSFMSLRKNPRLFHAHFHFHNHSCEEQISRSQWLGGENFVGKKKKTIWIHFVPKPIGLVKVEVQQKSKLKTKAVPERNVGGSKVPVSEVDHLGYGQLTSKISLFPGSFELAPKPRRPVLPAYPDTTISTSNRCRIVSSRTSGSVSATLKSDYSPGYGSPVIPLPPDPPLPKMSCSNIASRDTVLPRAPASVFQRAVFSPGTINPLMRPPYQMSHHVSPPEQVACVTTHLPCPNISLPTLGHEIPSLSATEGRIRNQWKTVREIIWSAREKQQEEAHRSQSLLPEHGQTQAPNSKPLRRSSSPLFCTPPQGSASDLLLEEDDTLPHFSSSPPLYVDGSTPLVPAFGSSPSSGFRKREILKVDTNIQDPKSHTRSSFIRTFGPGRSTVSPDFNNTTNPRDITSSSTEYSPSTYTHLYTIPKPRIRRKVLILSPSPTDRMDEQQLQGATLKNSKQKRCGSASYLCSKTLPRNSEKVMQTGKEMMSVYGENLSPASRLERIRRERSGAQRPLRDARDNRAVEMDLLSDICSDEMGEFVDGMLRKMKREKNARKIVEDSEDEV